MRPYVSYSELSSFANDCQWRWKLDYLEKHRTENFSIHFDFGTAVHETLERHITRNEPLTADEAVAAFQEKFKELVGKNSSKYGDAKYDVNGLLKSGSDIILCLHQLDELKNAEVVHNEYPILGDIDREDGLSIRFKGFIDLVIKTKDKRGNVILYVIDFKTCSWGWDRATREDRWKHYQLFLYKYYLCKKFNIDPKLVRTAFVLLKKRPPKDGGPVEFFPVSAGPVSVQRALDTLNSVITEMAEREKDGSFVKNRSKCVDRYGKKCPFYQTPLCPE